MKDPKSKKNTVPSLQLHITLREPGSTKLMHSLHVQLRAAIGDGRLAAGIRLPPTRVLASSLNVSRNTVSAAYDLLLSEGYITTLPGSAGTYVTSILPRPKKKASKFNANELSGLMTRRLQPAWRENPPTSTTTSATSAQEIYRLKYDFRLGTPDQRYLRWDIWARLSVRTLRQLAKQPAEYDDAQGSSALREAVAKHVSATRAVACEANDVLTTSGAQQAFDLLARVLVTPGRTVVAVENPGYPPLRNAFLSYGAILITIAVDSEGIVVDQLPKNVRVIYVTPSHQFPTGVVMSARRRAELMAFAVANEACIIEDDYDSEFRFGARPLDALRTLDRHRLVFYVGTFSKSLFPALRLGFMVMPPWASAALLRAKRLADSLSPTHTQETLAAFMAEGHFHRHVRKMNTVYAERRQTLLDALARHCGDILVPTESIAGLHVGVHVQVDQNPEQLSARAAARSVGLEAFSRYSLTDAVPQGFALGYGAIVAEDIENGVRLLRQVLNK